MSERDAVRTAIELSVTTSGDEFGNRFPDRPSPFVDREQALVRTLLYLSPRANPMGVFVHGFGGIGKTTLALEAAFRAFDAGYFDSMAFLSAQSTLWDEEAQKQVKVSRRASDRFASFRGLLAALERLLGMRTTVSKDDFNHKKRRHRISRGLTGSRWLIIIDNLDAIQNEKDVEQFVSFVDFDLPRHNKALITSRNLVTEFGAVAKVRLDSLDNASSYDMLAELCDKENIELNRRQAELLLEASAGNPLVLKHAVALASLYDVDYLVGRPEQFGNRSFLHYLFESAMSQLSDYEQRVLYAISVGRRAFTIAELADVSELPPGVVSSAIDVLDRLSLLEALSGRWRLSHYLIAEFAEAYLEGAPARKWKRLRQRAFTVASGKVA